MLLNCSISYINHMLKKSIFNGIDGGNIRQFGVCELIKNSELKDAKKMPAELNEDGEAIYAGIDDNYSIVTYHRVTDLKFDQEKGQNFGDSNGSTVLIADATLFCYAKTRMVRIPAYDLATRIGQAISINFSKEKLIEIGAKSIVSTPVSATIDTSSILKQEYNIEDLELVGEAYMFSLKYQITIKYNGCQNPCK